MHIVLKKLYAYTRNDCFRAALFYDCEIDRLVGGLPGSRNLTEPESHRAGTARAARAQRVALMSKGWIETDNSQCLPTGILSVAARRRAYPYALLASNVYQENSRADRGDAALVYNWVELLASNKERALGLRLSALRAFLGRFFGFDADLYKIRGPYEACWVLAFRGSASPFPRSPRGVVAAIQSWALTNLPATLDVLEPIESAMPFGLFDRFLNPRNAPATQYDLADLVTKAAARRFGANSLVLTGHSLGGGLAQYASVRNNLRAIVFNSAGVGFRLSSADQEGALESAICHLMTVDDPAAIERLRQIAMGYSIQLGALGVAVSAPQSFAFLGTTIAAGRTLSAQPMPNMGALVDQLVNRVVTTYTDPLSRHLGAKYVIGIGGHDMDEVLRCLSA